MPIAAKFAPFQTITHAYKVVNGHEILVDVLVPKKLLEAGADSEVKKQKRPLVARFHGGGLVRRAHLENLHLLTNIYHICRLEANEIMQNGFQTG